MQAERVNLASFVCNRGDILSPINNHYKANCLSEQGFFLGVSGAEIRPHSQWKLGDFFPNLEKKIPNHS